MIDENRIQEIIVLSRRLGNEPEEIIEMIKHHAKEIEELYKGDNQHFAVETGDLIILAIQLLLMEGYDTKSIIEKCYGRFDKKLRELLKNVDKK